MNIFVLDTNMDTVAIVDTYTSLIWTERYSESGDFELHTFVDSNILSYLRKDYYLVTNESDAVMIIENIILDTDEESGNYVTLTGRSAESILERRIVWGQRNLSGNFQEAVKTILNENLISPTNRFRKIDKFIFEESDDEAITSLNVEIQFTGESLYEAIKELCDRFGLGFKVTLNNSGEFVFKLYSGKDRTYSQLENPYVVFSPKFDNIINSSYMESDKALKNVVLIAGEGEGAERKTATIGFGSGLSRRELFVDARDISSTTETGTLTTEEYNARLKQRGWNKIAENTSVSSFEGKADATRIFKYGEHFFMGDIVQIANEYGIDGKARITELIRSHSESGMDVYPTFNMIEDVTTHTKSGEVVALDDISASPHVVDVKLRSKNLIPYPYTFTTLSTRGIDFTVNGDGSITVKGTATETFGVNLPIPTIPSGVDIVISGGFVDENGVRFVVNARKSAADGGSASFIESPKTTWNKNCGQLLPGEKIVQISMYIYKGCIVDTTVYPQLEIGTVATPYKPYVADDTEVTVKSIGKNLIPYPYVETTKTNKGVAFTDNGDGSITVNGTATADGSYIFYNSNTVKVNGIYTLGGITGGDSTGSSLYYLQIYVNGVSHIYVANGSKTTELNGYLSKVVMFYKTGAVFNNVTVYPQIEIGTVATPYEPYTEGETATTKLTNGVEFNNMSPNMTVLTDTDGVIIDATYRTNTEL